MQTRQPLLDGLKIAGSQLLALHHFLTYGPIALACSLAFPAVVAWFYEYARMAVQIFLVLGGYLAVQSLSPTMSHGAASLAKTLLRRYLRLSLPFALAMLLAVLCTDLSRWLAPGDEQPAAASLTQWLAHVLLLHGGLGTEALSAGVWYVAIDFQLFAMLAVLLWLGLKIGPRAAKLLVLALTLASLYGFNRHPELDAWGLYFFGSYGLGVAAFWAGRSQRPLNWLLLLAAVGLGALAVDMRWRVLLALGLALTLGWVQWVHGRRQTEAGWWRRPLHRLGQTSYSLYLLHFPVLMLACALFRWGQFESAAAGWFALCCCWLASMAAAQAFERWVEHPIARWTYRRSKGSTRAAASRPDQSSAPLMR